MPHTGGETEQRFVHLQENGPEMNRALLETRVNHNSWFLDTFLKSCTNRLALTKGQTSLGVRMNKVSWFKGVLKELHIHQQALPAQELNRV